MAAPLKAGMPPDLVIDGSYKVRLTAVDATSGAVVSGVKISGMAIQAVDLTGAFKDLTPGPLLVPSSSLV